MAFRRTTAVNRIRAMKKRIKVIPGGSSAGKTIAILAILIDKACKDKKKISVISESLPHLKQGAIRDFKTLMQETNRWVESRWNSTNFTYTFWNGSFIEFFSAENKGKVTGPRRDILYVNEANHIPWEVFDAAAIRTFEDIYIDFNPANSFWAHERMVNDECEWLTLTYKDNEGLPESILKELLRRKAMSESGDTYWKNWWTVYGEGKTGNIEGLIYPNWQMIPDSDFPKEDGFFGAIDYGYTNDPTGAVKIVRIVNNIYVQELCYESGIAPVQLKQIFESVGFNGNQPIYSEHDPDMISQLRRLGMTNVTMARKGQGSIKAGILKMNEYNIFYTASSKNIRNEQSRYSWVKRDDGSSSNEPDDKWNHLLDAIRYGVYSHYYRG